VKFLGQEEDEYTFWNGEYVFTLWEDVLRRRNIMVGDFEVNQIEEVRRYMPAKKLVQRRVSNEEINLQLAIVIEKFPELLV
jgi:hypothetical protein